MKRLAIILGLLLCARLTCAQAKFSGGKQSGGSVVLNSSGPPTYFGSPQGIGTAVNITSVPNAGTSVAAGCSGANLYLLIQCGNLSGSGKAMTDPQFTALGGQPVHYLRLTDAYFTSGGVGATCPAFSGAGGQNSFEIGPGGGDYTNVFNTNHTFVFVAQNGAGTFVVPVRSDYGASGCPLWRTGDGDTGPYSATSTIGMMDNTAWWSGVNPNVFYIRPSTAIYKMTMAGCDLTHTTTAQGCTVTSSLIHDFNGDACFGTEMASCAGNTKCWNGVFNVDVMDTYFAITQGTLGGTFDVLPTQVGQDTGTKAAFYDAVHGCKEWDTRKGLISPTYNSPPSQTITDNNGNFMNSRGPIHDDTMTRSGTAFSVGVTLCEQTTAALPTPRLTAWPGASQQVKVDSTTTYIWLLPVNSNTKGAMVFTSAGGTTGATEPNWDSLSLNGTVTDGTVTWTYYGNFGALTDWSASIPYAAYMFIQPTSNNAGGYVYQQTASSGGISGSSRPSFGQTIGGNTTDNGATWQNVGTTCTDARGGWSPSTNTVYPFPSAIYTGHYMLEANTIVIGGGTLTFGGAKYSAWTNVEPLIPNNPACTAATCPGEHITAANQSNGLDNLPVIGGMAYGTNAINTKLAADTTGCKSGSTFPVSCAAIANSPGYEIVGYQQANLFCAIPNSTCPGSIPNPDTYIRFGFQFNTGQSNFFNGQQGTGGTSQDGTGFAFTSDWMGTLGNTQGGTNAAPNGIDWKASQTWATGTIINPAAGNAGNYSYTASAGTGTGTEPTWSTCATVGSTCSDGGVTWTNIGSPTGSAGNSAGPRIDAFIMKLN